MPDRSRKRPRDLNQLAKSIVDEATGEKPRLEPEERVKDPAAVSLGRKGGLKGGMARAAKLSAEERSEAARRAAQGTVEGSLESYASVDIEIERKLHRFAVPRVQSVQLDFEVRPILAQFHDRDHGPEMFSETRVADVRREPLKQLVLTAPALSRPQARNT